MDHPSTVKNSNALRENLTSSTRHPHHTSINRIDSSRQWSRKSKPHIRKWTDLWTLKREPYFSYVTPRSWKIYHPRQKSYMDGLHKELSCPDATDSSTSQESANDFSRYKTCRKNTSTELTKPRMRKSWKWEKSPILSTEAVQCKTKVVTGTVVEILERGRSYIIEGPNGKKYRRNWAHLKPLCHDGSSFQDPLKAKRQIPTRRDNVDSFQDPGRNPGNELHSRTGRQLSHHWNTQLKLARHQNLHIIHLIMYIHPDHPHHHHQHSSHPENI